MRITHSPLAQSNTVQKEISTRHRHENTNYVVIKNMLNHLLTPMDEHTDTCKTKILVILKLSCKILKNNPLQSSLQSTLSAPCLSLLHKQTELYAVWVCMSKSIYLKIRPLNISSKNRRVERERETSNCSQQ